MPVDWSKYPRDWKTIRERILERAGHCCERCGLANYALGYRDHEGRFWTDEAIDRLDGGDTIDGKPYRRIRIVLTTAHLCSCDPLCGNLEHLQALCQACHNRLDAPSRAKNAAATRRARKIAAVGQQELF